MVDGEEERKKDFHFTSSPDFTFHLAQRDTRMQGTVIRSEVSEVHFGLYSDEETRKLSCCKISSPLAFDGLGNPLNSGLYDPLLGPVSQHGLPCATCGMLYVNCPGHPGHIDLSVPVYQPLLFANMFQLLRVQCANCHRFRSPVNKVRMTLIKLKLVEMGMINESEDVETLCLPPTVFTDESVEMQADADSKLQEYEEMYEAFAKKSSRQIPDSRTKKLQRDLVADFYRSALSCKSCSSCGSFSPSIRKDGYTKIFERPLAKRLRKSMQGMRINLKPALETVTRAEGINDLSDDDSDDDAADTMDAEEESDGETGAQGVAEFKDKYLTPYEVEARLRLLWEAHSDFLNFIWSRSVQHSVRGSKAWTLFFVKSLLVPPSRFRPSSDLGDVQAEHPQNLHLSKILTLNESLLKLAVTSASTSGAQNIDISLLQEKVGVDVSKLISIWIDLQNAVNCYLDSSKDPKARAGEDSAIGIRQILEKKEGLFRKHMMGKRVNYCCRSVISPDPFLGMNEIGIPVQFAKELHYPTPVTSWNIKLLRQMVENGPDTYPGANQIESADGRIIKLDRFSRQERVAKAKLLMSGPGVKVYRHLINGDFLLVNRQPTLHKPGIMAHKARVLEHVPEQTLRMNYANCNAYNADFDGDEMNCHFVQNEVARAEAAFICNTDNQYIVPTSGNPLRGLIQDHVASGVKMTCRDTFLRKEDFQQLLYIAVTGLIGTGVVGNCEDIVMPMPAILKPVQLWTGKQVISSLLRHVCRPPLPPLHLDGKSRTPAYAFGAHESEHTVVFRHGELLSGVIDKASIGNSSLGVVHAVYELYGPTLAGLLLSAFGRLFTYHLQSAGHTCGIEDLTMTATSDITRRNLLTEVEREAERGLKNFFGLGNDKKNAFTEKDKFQCEKKMAALLHSEKLEGKVKVDGAIQAVINKSASEVLKSCLPAGLEVQFPKNNFSMMVLTGAKGSSVNQSQISCFLGQQALEGQRVPLMISGKTLPSFRPYDSQARAGGFITDRFLTGVRPQEYFFHCMAGREGLVDTAVKTSRSGYLQRCLVKHLEELKVNYDMSVRDSAGNIVQFLYGDDGLDPTASALLGGSDQQLLFLSRNHQALVNKYSLDSEKFLDGFDMNSARKYNFDIANSRKVAQSKLGDYSPCALSGANTIFDKKSVVFARRRVNTFRPWSRQNMCKRWFPAEIMKVRQASDNFLCYDIKYSDGTVDKRVPARMRINPNSCKDKDDISKSALVSLIKPALLDPVMSVLPVQSTMGAVSEKIQDKLNTYVLSNPHAVISDSTTEQSVSAGALELLVWIKYMRSLACPGEAVGCVAAQSVGEPSTQMTLNTFHLAGHGGANVTLGIPRLREIIMTASKTLKTPTMTTPLRSGQTRDVAKTLALQFSRICVSDLLHHERGIEVGEIITRNAVSSKWERHYRVRFYFEDCQKVKENFGVEFDELLNVVKKVVVRHLHQVVQLEQRRTKGFSKVDVVHQVTSEKTSSTSRSDDEEGGGNNDGDDEIKNSINTKRKVVAGIDSDDEDADEDETMDDGEDAKPSQDLSGYGTSDDEDESSNEINKSALLNKALAYFKGKDFAIRTPMLKKDDAAKKTVVTGRVGYGCTVGDVKGNKDEGWVEMLLAFPAHTRKLLMVQLAELACHKACVRETKDISNAYVVECDVEGEKRFAVQTEGVNFEAVWSMANALSDTSNISSNDIWKILITYGVEAARQSIVSEVLGVFGVYGINVNPRHLSLIADFMTRTGSYLAMNRIGMSDCPSPFLQMSFETTCTFLTESAQEGAVEKLESSSARIVTGGVPRVGTGCFDIMHPLSMKE